MTNQTKTALIIMEAIEGVDTTQSSSYMIAMEALKRGWRLYHVLPGDIMADHEKVYGHVHELVFDETGTTWAMGEYSKLNLATTDVILMRQDPPFDMKYLSATYMLSMIADQTLILNNPESVRHMGEKFSALNFPHLAPETIVTAKKEDIEAFREKHENIIIKPIYGHGGASIVHIGPESQNLSSIYEMYKYMDILPVVVQRQIPEVYKGDKRILMVDGEICGGFTRIPADGEARANIHAGGTAIPLELTEKDKAICDEVGPFLKKTGLFFVGLDIIGERLIEINMSSPGGLEDVLRFDNRNVAEEIWKAIEKKI